MLGRNIVALAEADAGGGGEQGELPLDDRAKKTDAGPSESTLMAELKAKDDRVAKLEAEAKKRADEEKKISDAKLIEDGKAKVLLAAREEELAVGRDRIAAFEKREKELAKGLFDKLSDADKEAAKVLEGKLSLSDWTDYLRSRAVAIADSGNAPPAGTPGSRGGKKLRELHPETVETLGQLYADDTVYRIGRHLNVIDTSDGKKFALDMPRFIKLLRGRASMKRDEPLSVEAIDKMVGA